MSNPQNTQLFGGGANTPPTTPATPAAVSTPVSGKRVWLKRGLIGTLGAAAGIGLAHTTWAMSNSGEANPAVVEPQPPTPPIPDTGGLVPTPEAIPPAEIQEVIIHESAPLSDAVNDGMSFGQAFAAARQDVGEGGLFVWHGEVYNTYLKEEWAAMTPEMRHDFADSFQINNTTDPNTGDVIAVIVVDPLPMLPTDFVIEDIHLYFNDPNYDLYNTGQLEGEVDTIGDILHNNTGEDHTLAANFGDDFDPTGGGDGFV